MPDLCSCFVSSKKPGQLQDRPAGDSLTLSFTWNTDVLLDISISVTSRQHFFLTRISQCLEYWSRRNRIFLEFIFMEYVMKRGP